MLNTTRVAFGGALAGLVAGVALLGAAPAARAVTTADKPASILVWPKIEVDTQGRFTGGEPVDTLIQLTNKRAVQKRAYCFYVNANSHCLSNPSQVCQTPADCPVSGGGFSPCVPGWSEIDFVINITQNQPLGWYASAGLRRGEFPLEGPGYCTTPPGRPCTRDQDCGFPTGRCQLGQTNLGSGIPPVPEDPFIGSLTCIQYDPAVNPPIPDQSLTRNAFVGHATIITGPTGNNGPGAVDVAKYNAVGVRATGTAVAGNVLNLGGPAAARNYDACPNTLILDHLFDYATDPVQTGNEVPGYALTTLTLVPCGNDFLTQTPGRVTAQFLIFNEYEQRFSTSRLVDCLLDSQLSLIDTRNPLRSVFSAYVAGTIAGQTRIRGVGSAPTGRGLTGVAVMRLVPPLLGNGTSAAYSLQQQGDPPSGTPPDVITVP